jgi:hypothetical protein
MVSNPAAGGCHAAGQSPHRRRRRWGPSSRMWRPWRHGAWWSAARRCNTRRLGGPAAWPILCSGVPNCLVAEKALPRRFFLRELCCDLAAIDVGPLCLCGEPHPSTELILLYITPSSINMLHSFIKPNVWIPLLSWEAKSPTRCIGTHTKTPTNNIIY